ncbi:nicotinate-nucleotide adenylyltransferase [Paenibacillus arenilitoris]|uniref:Probable nicotinate-nucleotide adenylyltransferase n=1 Tax=Paenibacillus arenilitoris TaxID=2772299 RepID=A0A927CV18_9BACL|nr:nicotinate-nucleotide adenylyltransferase [Paenibacillus arenilitoris]MBD2872721.1 nicotinate-nucleotide adenylyltransferase [Paenibacillus arenilitoris]
MSKIGIMGGTFDPVHIGHLIAAETARDACGLDEVWFIPSSGPPLKAHEPGVAGRRRYEMVCEAIAGNPAFRALDIELERGGVSYSYDTALELKHRYPEHSFSYIIGSDRINDLPRWHEIGELAKLVAFIGLERPGEAIRAEALPEYLTARIRVIPMPAIGISSTAIRTRLGEGQSVQYLVPDAVLGYIRRFKLYES